MICHVYLTIRLFLPGLAFFRHSVAFFLKDVCRAEFSV